MYVGRYYNKEIFKKKEEKKMFDFEQGNKKAE
jgi:hypothetical protein